MDFLPGGISPEDAAKLMRSADAYERLKGSPLVRVIGIGQQREADSIRVELIALEMREGGAILYWRAYPLGQQFLGDAVVAVTDERGTDDGLPIEGGCDASQWKGEIGITPVPHSQALCVEVLGFSAFGRGIPRA
jgi:hypothetical protein